VFLGPCHHTAPASRAAVARALGQAGIRPLIGISDLFEHKQLAPGEGMGPYGCCYLPDSVLDESDFVGLEQTKKMRVI
jgi:hypothetical protein